MFIVVIASLKIRTIEPVEPAIECNSSKADFVYLFS